MKRKLAYTALLLAASLLALAGCSAKSSQKIIENEELPIKAESDEIEELDDDEDLSDFDSDIELYFPKEDIEVRLQKFLKEWSLAWRNNNYEKIYDMYVESVSPSTNRDYLLALLKSAKGSIFDLKLIEIVDPAAMEEAGYTIMEVLVEADYNMLIEGEEEYHGLAHILIAPASNSRYGFYIDMEMEHVDNSQAEIDDAQEAENTSANAASDGTALQNDDIEVQLQNFLKEWSLAWRAEDYEKIYEMDIESTAPVSRKEHYFSFLNESKGSKFDLKFVRIIDTAAVVEEGFTDIVVLAEADYELFTEGELVESYKGLAHVLILQAPNLKYGFYIDMDLDRLEK